MRSAVSRRISNLEALLPVPLTAKGFTSRAHRVATNLGVSVAAARDKLLADLSDGELAALGAEFERVAFGSDIAARDAAKREVFAAAGCPVLDKDDSPGAEECTW